MIYCLTLAGSIPSLCATEVMVNPEPSKRFPRSELIARSSQISGVREEVVVIVAGLEKDGIGVKEPVSRSRSGLGLGGGVASRDVEGSCIMGGIIPHVGVPSQLTPRLGG